jgi:hypothetical protein
LKVRWWGEAPRIKVYGAEPSQFLILQPSPDLADPEAWTAVIPPTAFTPGVPNSLYSGQTGTLTWLAEGTPCYGSNPPQPACSSLPYSFTYVIPELKISTYVACGLSGNAKKASVCPKHSKVGAFFRSTLATTYKLCVRYPNRKTRCGPPRETAAEVLYVDKVNAKMPGVYQLSWFANGQRIDRSFRLRG